MKKILLFFMFFLIATPCFSAQFLFKQIEEDGNGDYTTLEACMNANEQDLTGDGWFDVEIVGTDLGGDGWGSDDTTQVVIDGYTTTADDYINIYTTSTARHDGTIWDTSAYRLVNSPYNNSTIWIKDDFVTITGIQVKNAETTDFNGTHTLRTDSKNTTFDKIIGIAVGGNVFFTGSVDYTVVTNSVFLNEKTQITCRPQSVDGAAQTLIYNTVCICLGGGTAISTGWKDFTATNVYAHSATGTGFGTVSTITTCASSDGSQSTTTVAYSTDTFVNVTGGEEDFHLVADSGLIDIGTDLSGTFTDDIDGDTRSGDWDIGIDDFAAAARRVIIISKLQEIYNKL